MTIENRQRESESTLDRALQTIYTDSNRFFLVGSSEDGKATRLDVYNRLFGQEARYGSTKDANGVEKFTPGYYQRFPNLSPEQIDKILENHIIKLANATILTHLGTFLEKDLRNAELLIESYNK